MFRPTPKELESCGFILSNECRLPLWFNENEFYYSKNIFLNTAVKNKNLDYKDWRFYLDGLIINISEDVLKKLKWSNYFGTDNELAQIQIDYPELVFNTKDNCYYWNFLQFRKSRNYQIFS